jgi:hypothetical protein
MSTLSNAIATVLHAWHTGDAAALLASADTELQQFYAEIGYKADGSGLTPELPYADHHHAIWVTSAEVTIGGTKYHHVNIRRQHKVAPESKNVHFMSMMFKETAGGGLLATDDISTLEVANGFRIGGLTTQLLPMHMGAYTNLLPKFQQTGIPAAVYTVE